MIPSHLMHCNTSAKLPVHPNSSVVISHTSGAVLTTAKAVYEIIWV